MTRKPLRHGYTTGACAAAAAKGAALMLASQETVADVTIHLPAGESVTFELHGQEFGPGSAACYVVKDAGDDPDVTNGAEVHARVTQLITPPPLQGKGWGGDGAASANSTNPTGKPHPHPAPLPEGEGIFSPSSPPTILIEGGAGIGRATKPGLAVAPGEWAINPVPRRMIEEAIREAFAPHPSFLALHVVISIPDGEERARKTLNSRLGIVGGLSILGTTGIVRPISAKAWTDTVDSALDVARACGCGTVVLSTGRTSELAAQRWLLKSIPPPLMGGGEGEGEAATSFQRSNSPPTPALPHQGGGGVCLPEEAFIMMGDHVAYALAACQKRGFERPLIACQFAKLLKIACGHENTHAAASELDLAALRQWAETDNLPRHLMDLMTRANTAREIIIAGGFDRRLLELVCRRAHAAVRCFAPSLQAEFLVADYSGNIVFHSR